MAPPPFMAPIHVWRRWVRLHKAGEEVRVDNRIIPMSRLIRSWHALGYRAQPAVREQFVRTHVEPYARSRVGLVCNVKTRDQLGKRRGSDVAYVERRVCVLKKFRTKNKYQRSMVALLRTASCQCTPAYHGCDEAKKQIIQEDVGKSLGELRLSLSSSERRELCDHFKNDHGMLIPWPELSAFNVCRRPSGLCLLDVAK